MEKANIGEAAQAALERIFDSLANDTARPPLHAWVDDSALAAAGLRYTRARARAHARTHARARARAHTHIHTYSHMRAYM